MVWREYRFVSYQIQNYTCISQGKHCSQHGGLLIYLHNNYTFEYFKLPFKSDTWEGLFIRILNFKTEKVIYNVYRPPKDNLNKETIQLFIDELNPILSEINKSNSTIILVGDFNINLLKITEKSIIREYLEFIINHGLFPNLTLPTRISDNSATMIDNIFSNTTNKCYIFQE